MTGRRVLDFHQDVEGHWVVTLECGHTQHLRHDPPWQVRPWVLDRAERDLRLGTLYPCGRCGEAEVRK